MPDLLPTQGKSETDKETVVSASSSDIETEPEGKRNGTATPQNEPESGRKVNNSASDKQDPATESSENEPTEAKPFAEYKAIQKRNFAAPSGRIVRTPLIREWLQMKRENPESFILVKIGNRYELLGEDAQKAGEILGIKVSSFANSNAAPTLLASFGVDELAEYESKLRGAEVGIKLYDAEGIYGKVALGEPDVRKSVGKNRAADELGYELAKGLLELTGVEAIEVDGETEQAMPGNKKTPLTGQPNRANEKLTSGSVLAAHVGGSSSNANDSRNHDAKLINDTQSAKNKIRKFNDGDATIATNNLTDAIRTLGALFSMRNKGGSRYTILKTDEGHTGDVAVKPHSFEVTNIKLLPEDNSSKVEPTATGYQGQLPHGTAKLLKGVEESYDKGVKPLEASEKAAEEYEPGSESAKERWPMLMEKGRPRRWRPSRRVWIRIIRNSMAMMRWSA